MQPVPDRRAEQASLEPTLSERGHRGFEHGDPRPWQGAGIRGEPVAIDHDPQPILDAPHHHRDHRTHVVGAFARRASLGEAALHRLASGDRLGDGEADGGVDADAACRGRLHGADAGSRRRELHDDVRRQCGEAGRLLDHRVGVTVEGGIGLDREPAGASAGCLEGGHEKRRGAGAHLRHDLPGHLALRPGGMLGDELGDSLLPARRLLVPDVDHDRRVRGGAHRTVADRVLELVDRAAVVPDVGGGLGDRPAERRFGQVRH